MQVEIGQILDNKYKLTRLIGQGGMGAVYEGTHLLIDRRVAIKVLLPTTDATAATRFEQEARAAGRIGSDHILEILDIGSLDDGAKYMVCEFLDGEPLSTRIQRRSQLQSMELAPLALQILTGLSAAHNAGIVHRDLKPDNVFILNEKAGKRDFVKIIDFGISKFSQLDGGDGLSMTKTGMVVGTPNYMSPEQARGLGGVDHRADLYAVGVMMYEALSGKLPFDAQTLNDLLFQVVLETPKPIDELVPNLDPKMAEIIKKAMARNPEDRYGSAQEFAAELDDWTKRNQLATGTAAVQLTDGMLRQLRDSGVDTLDPRALAGGPQGTLPPELTRGRTVVAWPSDNSSRDSIVSALTPGAFGATRDFEAARVEPIWRKRNVQLAAIGAAAVLVLVVSVALLGGSDGDSADLAESDNKTDQAAAARADADKKAEKIEPDTGPSEADLEAQKKADDEAAEKKRLAEETRLMEEAKAKEAKAKEEEAKAKETEAKRAAAAPRPAPRAVAPQPRPTPAPAPAPSKKRHNFGY